ncbi:MAG TPA: hypothetical protein VLY04_10920 [Bryobacteraceae bacterium]|nr:hypothetical protein [Bryobacteraceae bacterium]
MRAVLVCSLFACHAFAQPTISGCPSFPANNIWNAAVDGLPVHAESGAFIAKIGPAAGLRLDDAMPINIVPRSQPKVTVGGLTNPESDAGGYAIPPNARLEAGSDAHAIVVERDRCILYELYAAKLSAGNWTAASGAKWDLNSNALRTDTWTSADAAGLPIMPGLLRYEEIAAGHVDHALRFSAPYTRGGVYQWPARHFASHHPDGPPMGLRVRLKASFDISGYSEQLQVILRGLKKYGAMLSDNGMPWGMQHDADPRWNAAELTTLHRVLGSNMEVVDVSGLMSDPNSGIAGPAAGMILVTDALGRPNAVKLGAGLTIVNGTLVVSH